MKRFFTLLTITLLWAVTAEAALDPIRISIATGVDLSGKPLTISILQPTGADFPTAKNISFNSGGNVPTDKNGVVSFVLNATTAPIWTNCDYDANNLVRVTYGTTVILIERMEVIIAKQGLFGAMVDPVEIAGGSDGYVLTTSGTTSAWALEKDPVVKGINGIVKSDGSNISPAVAGTDYIAPYGTQAKNIVFAGPASGSDAAPGFRGLVDDDIPAILTLSGSTIENSIIGASTPAAGTFTTAAVKTGSYKTSFTAGTQTADVAYVLPTADGTNGQVLKTAGDGTLSWTNLTSGGTVSSVSVATAAGVSGSVSNASTTPEITITLGDITPTKVNGYTLPAAPGTNGYVLTTNGDGTTNWTSFSGTGTVTNVSVTSNNGITSSVANPTGAAALTLGLGDITPTKVNGYTLPAVIAGNAGKVLTTDATGITSWISAGTGTVTSVGLTMPSIFAVTSSPITTLGTIDAALNTQVMNRVFAGPTSGSDAVPTFRALTDADIPDALTLSGLTIPAGGLVLGDGTNNTTIETDGTISHNGTATVWDDLRIQILTRTAGTTPTFDGGFGGNANIFTYNFSDAATKSVYFEVQMPHSWKQGTTIYPHVHWAPEEDNASGNVCKWQLEYTWVNYQGTFGASSTYTMNGATDVANVKWKHYIASGAGISGTGKNISSMLICRLSRIGGDAADNLSGDACLIAFDIHFEKDTEGSRTEYTK